MTKFTSFADFQITVYRLIGKIQICTWKRGFCIPWQFLAVPRRRFLRRCWEEGDWCVGAVAVGPLRLAADWWMPWPVQGLWSAAVGSGAAPRRRRLGRPDLEVEGELGARPRPARHSDMWAFVLLLVVHKAYGRWSSLNLGCAGLRLPLEVLRRRRRSTEFVWRCGKP